MKTAGAHPVHKATIMPRGNALGMVMQLPDGDQTSMSRKQVTWHTLDFLALQGIVCHREKLAGSAAGVYCRCCGVRKQGEALLLSSVCLGLLPWKVVTRKRLLGLKPRVMLIHCHPFTQCLACLPRVAHASPLCTCTLCAIFWGKDVGKDGCLHGGQGGGGDDFRARERHVGGHLGLRAGEFGSLPL